MIDFGQALIFKSAIVHSNILISQKSENISLKSKIRRLTNELDGLRNQSIDDDIDIEDDIENNISL